MRKTPTPRDLTALKVVVFMDQGRAPVRELRARGAAVTVVPDGAGIRALRAILDLKPQIVVSSFRFRDLMVSGVQYVCLDTTDRTSLDEEISRFLGTIAAGERLGEVDDEHGDSIPPCDAAPGGEPGG